MCIIWQDRTSIFKENLLLHSVFPDFLNFYSIQCVFPHVKLSLEVQYLVMQSASVSYLPTFCFFPFILLTYSSNPEEKKKPAMTCLCEVKTEAINMQE